MQPFTANLRIQEWVHLALVQGVGTGQGGKIAGMVGARAQDWRLEPLSRGGMSRSAFSETTVMPHGEGDGGLGRGSSCKV